MEDSPALLERTPDDSLRFQSVMFAIVRALDKVGHCLRVADMCTHVLMCKFLRGWETRRLRPCDVTYSIMACVTFALLDSLRCYLRKARYTRSA